ncbi:MAG: tRNA pseudouridine(38-40) synthase TruA [Fusicatenibacter sp.]|nr:tRNA pseudouridine(38-40) synthase TruA [Lachnospiraceae bacterium]MDY2938286.1 tRNA pseudouridine(38-40) synthase TruA [Fusicatenibacter sp.]
MRRIKLTVAYDGTNYCGWQVQPNGMTVQEALNDALSDLFGCQVNTIGASRTDAGVHALGNVAVFDTDARMPADKVAFALNTRLPEDIRIQKSEEVPPEFHPRFTSTVKTYEYCILNRTFCDPTRRLYAAFWYGRLDVEAMREAAGYLVGTHDFKSFATENPDVTDTVRTIYETRVWKENDMIHFRITGNGFLYNMVRIIAGTLLEVGKGSYSPDAVREILKARDRTKAGPTARPQGLTLLEIRYPEWEEENRRK